MMTGSETTIHNADDGISAQFGKVAQYPYHSSPLPQSTTNREVSSERCSSMLIISHCGRIVPQRSVMRTHTYL